MELKKKDKFAIVAVGASAGNQEALHEFFAEIPTTINACFVIVLHLLRDHRSRMPEIISKFTAMNVVRVSDNCKLKPGNVYVMPEGVTMEIKAKRLYLHPRNSAPARNTAIDDFFFAFAHEEHEKSIAVVLSGMGTDGTQGAIAIHDDGGKILVQDPSTTQYDGMPSSVISFDHPDIIASPRALGRALEKMITQRYEKETIENH
jgi:two-component system CheB/CheR fusion protein